jgi:hypothetical protein
MLNQIPEIQVAVKFIASCLYGKLPRRRADLFAEELSSAIQTKFQGHWYADQPAKGSGFRCLHFTSKEVDPVFHKASEASGLAFNEISVSISFKEFITVHTILYSIIYAMFFTLHVIIWELLRRSDYTRNLYVNMRKRIIIFLP